MQVLSDEDMWEEFGGELSHIPLSKAAAATVLKIVERDFPSRKFRLVYEETSSRVVLNP